MQKIIPCKISCKPSDTNAKLRKNQKTWCYAGGGMWLCGVGGDVMWHGLAGGVVWFGVRYGMV